LLGTRISATKMLLVIGMILRIAAVVVAFSNYALAQFFSLATGADGSRLYFATPLRQKNTVQPTYGKLFRNRFQWPEPAGIPHSAAS